MRWIRACRTNTRLISATDRKGSCLVGVFVSMPFSKESELLREHEETPHKVDRLLDCSESRSALQRQALHKALDAQFELGWAVFYSDGDELEIAKMQQTERLEIDWSRAEISDFTPSDFTLMLPRFRSRGGGLHIDWEADMSITTIPREGGKPILVYSLPRHPQLWVRVLGNDPAAGVVCVVGFAMKPPKFVVPPTTERED